MAIDVGESRGSRRRRWRPPTWTSSARSGELLGEASAATGAARINASSDPIGGEDGDFREMSVGGSGLMEMVVVADLSI